MASKVIKDKIKSELNDKQKQFCIEYLKDLNVTQAYKRAYECDDESARTNGCRLITNDNIKEYINSLLDEYKDNCDVTIAEIVSNVKKIAFDETARNSDRIKASELLVRYKQMFVERIEITNNNEVQLTEEEINKQLIALGYNIDKSK